MFEIIKIVNFFFVNFEDFYWFFESYFDFFLFNPWMILLNVRPTLFSQSNLPACFICNFKDAGHGGLEVMRVNKYSG